MHNIFSAMDLKKTSNKRLFLWLALSMVLMITALIYWPGTHGAFLLDDFPNIVQNSAFKDLKPTPSSILRASISSESGVTHRPITMMTFAFNVLMTRGDHKVQNAAASMKMTNVIIHLLNGLLIFILLRLILRQYQNTHPETSKAICDWTSLLVTAAWLLAPINLTAVLYIVQRMTSLSATFSLLGLICYVSGRSALQRKNKKVGWFLLFATALIFTPLSIFSKENGVLTIAYAYVIEWVLFSGQIKSNNEKRAVNLYFITFLLLPLIIGLCWLIPQTLNPQAWEARNFNFPERLLTEGRVIWHYIWWTLVPDLNSLTLFHDGFPVSHSLIHPWTTLPALIGIGALLIAGISTRRSYPLVSLGLLWFLVGQTLTASFIPLELVFEHREYLPSLGLFTAVLATALILIEKRPQKRLIISAIMVIILLYGVALSLRSITWSNPLRQLALAARYNPNSPRAAYGYARILTIYSEVDPRLTDPAFKALEKARDVPGQDILPDATLIVLANRTNRPVNPNWYYRMARILSSRPINPGDISSLYSLVHCGLQKKAPCKLDPDLMQLVFASALTRPHPSSTIMAMYGNYLLNVTRQPHEARKMFNLLVKNHPGTAVYHFDLGVTEVACHDLAAAERELAMLRRLNKFGMSNQHIKSLSNLINQARDNSRNHG